MKNKSGKKMIYEKRGDSELGYFVKILLWIVFFVIAGIGVYLLIKTLGA